MPKKRPGSGVSLGKRYGVSAVALLAAASVFAALAVYASPHFRGSDQYWFVEDVTTLVAGRPAVTHETYPFSLIGVDRRFDDVRPFIHNGPGLHVWAVLSRLLGDVHAGILAGNIAFSLLAAAFVWATARRLTSPAGAVAAAAVFLFVPVGFWITSQDMSEPFSVMLVALALLLVVRFPDRLGAFAGAQAALALAAVGRVWTLPFLLLLPVGLLALDRVRPWPSRIGRAAAALTLGLAMFLLLAAAFPVYMPRLDPMTLLDVSRGAGNMTMFFRTSAAPPFAPRAFLRGFGANTLQALRTQFSLSASPFAIARQSPVADFWPFNLLALASLAGMVMPTADRMRRFVAGLGVVAFGMHLAIASLYQNQPRYLVPLLPALVLGAAAALHVLAPAARARVPRATVVVAVAVLLGAFLYADVQLASGYRRGAMRTHESRRLTAEVVSESIPAGARVVLDTKFSNRWSWDHALYPREVLALGIEFPFTPDEYRRMLAEFEPRYLVADKWSPLPHLVPVRALGTGYGCTVYELIEAP